MRRTQLAWNLPKLMGNPANGIIPYKDTVYTFSDIVGSQSKERFSSRLNAGELLGLIDITAALCAKKHIGKTPDPSLKGMWSTTTVSADSLVFRLPVVHGDQVRLTGSVANVGKSSLTIDIDVSRVRFPTRELQHISDARLTFVAIGKNLRPLPIVPAVEYQTEADLKIHEIAVCAKNWERKLQDQLDVFTSSETPDWQSIEDPINAAKPMKVGIEDTEVVANRLFFPGHLNLNKTIFGGEMLRWMERHAVHCGRLFTGNRNIASIAMHGVVFREPVYVTDFVTLRSYVAYVRNTTMEVDVELAVERDGMCMQTTRASFVMMQYDDIGQRLPLLQGLRLEGAPRKWLLRYAQAKQRYESSRQNAEF